MGGYFFVSMNCFAHDSLAVYLSLEQRHDRLQVAVCCVALDLVAA